MSNLSKNYQEVIRIKLAKDLGLDNIMAVPKLKKIVINIGLGEAINNKKVISHVENQLALISGQKPIVTKARQSIAGFKLREGVPIGMKVTLRGAHMYDFFEKLVKIVLPRLRDFRGLKVSSFDSLGNYTIGLSEQIVFPEVDYDAIDKIRGLEITIVTSAKGKIDSKRLLEMLGMPFMKEEKKSKKT